MITENLSTLKINVYKTQEQYDREKEAGNINENELHLTPDMTDEEIVNAVNNALAQAKASGEFKGDKGDKGDKGEDGKDGSDASVTSENIALALGYTPANPNTVPSKTETWTFTLEDGSTVTKEVYVG